MRKSVLKVACFLSLLAIAMKCFTKVYAFKYGDGIMGLTTFYEQKDNINDVIFVGSSHIFEDVNTQVLWDEYGIASYDLAGSTQPMWNSYYYIQEAFKTQTPCLVVLDLLGVIRYEEYMVHSVIIKNTYGMKSSLDKIEAVTVSAPEDSRQAYLWEIPTYHTRYKELSVEDFLPYQGVANREAWKGFGINTSTTVCEVPAGFKTDTVTELTEKTETYLRKICELCEENDTFLLLIKSPYVTDYMSTTKFNRAAQIGAEYGVPCIDFNYYYDDMELNFTDDFGDPWHLNYKGNIKFSRYLADYLKNHYNIPDRRGEMGYESYDIISRDCIMRTQNAAVKATEDLTTFLHMVQDESYIVIYSVCGEYKNASNYEDVAYELSKYGISLENAENSNVWVIQNGDMLFSSNNTYDYLWHMELAPYKDIEVKAEDDYGATPSVIFNRESMVQVTSGLNVVIYDTVTESIVDAAGFPVEDGEIQNQKVGEKMAP